MNLYHLLQKRADEGKPVLAALIGAGSGHEATGLRHKAESGLGRVRKGTLFIRWMIPKGE
jgi:hypothetical protein